MLVIKGNGSLSNDGLYVKFADVTGQSSPTAYTKGVAQAYSDIYATRFLIASLTKLESTATKTAGETLKRYKQYIKTNGSPSTIDGKVFTVGSIFCFMANDVTVPSGDTWEETGKIAVATGYSGLQSTWLPTLYENPISFSQINIGNTDNSAVTPDDLYTLEYEVYYGQATGTFAAVSGVQYMPVTASATYGGNTYKPGEIFIATNTNNIISAGYVAKLLGAQNFYFVFTYTLISNILLLLEKLNGQNLPDVEKQIYDIRVQLEALSYSAQTNNVSYSYTKAMIEDLNAKVTYLLNNY